MKEKISRKLNKILPISDVVAILGVFFTIFSVIYVVLLQFFKGNDLILALVVEGVVLFVTMLITFFIVAIKINKHRVDEDKIDEITEYRNIMVECVGCVNERVKDGFHYFGLLTFKELIEYEASLAKDKSPKECYVIIYTSDLATELNASKEVHANIEAGVNYRVIYFKNSCSQDELSEIRQLYGEKNLLDLSSSTETKSIDEEFSDTLGFDIMIYKNSENEIKGYFAVDFVPDVKNYCPPSHIMNCGERCNYSTGNEPFYKAISDTQTRELFKQMLKCFD